MRGFPGCTLVSTASHIIIAFTSSFELDEITRSGFLERLSTTSTRLMSVWKVFTASSCLVVFRREGGGEQKGREF